MLLAGLLAYRDRFADVKAQLEIWRTLPPVPTVLQTPREGAIAGIRFDADMERQMAKRGSDAEGLFAKIQIALDFGHLDRAAEIAEELVIAKDPTARALIDGNR